MNTYILCVIKQRSTVTDRRITVDNVSLYTSFNHLTRVWTPAFENQHFIKALAGDVIHFIPNVAITVRTYFINNIEDIQKILDMKDTVTGVTVEDILDYAVVGSEWSGIAEQDIVYLKNGSQSVSSDMMEMFS